MSAFNWGRSVNSGMFVPTLFVLAGAANLVAQPLPVKVDWNKTIRDSRSTPTLQVVVNPPLRRGSKIHDRTFEELKKLGADYVRYVPWLPYPRLGVAELEPPASGKTSWDFSLIDPMTIDFLEATEGHPVMLNFSTIPQWMFKTNKPVAYPEDPDKPVWDYQKGTELRDPSMKELADYYARLVSWYTKGGFTDEVGKFHKSGHKYKIAYWEVLNEVDLEHNMTPQQYTERYDAIVTAIHKVDPQIKFVGLALAFPGRSPEMFEYFLNPKNHKPGIPLDMISYHFYAAPNSDEPVEVQPYTFFAQADQFLTTVRYIESIRKRLSPGTQTTVNEIGSIAADDMMQSTPGHRAKPIPDSYWLLSGATYAYVFAGLVEQGIEVIGESQLVGYPTQFPSVSMVDWNTGAPNARFRVLELLENNFGPGDKLMAVPTGMAATMFKSQAFFTRDGKRKILLISKRDRPIELSLEGAVGATIAVVDQTTMGEPARIEKLQKDTFRLPRLAVAVVSLP